MIEFVKWIVNAYKVPFLLLKDIIFVAVVPHVALHGPSDQGPNSQSTKTESKILSFRENSLYVLVLNWIWI